MLVFFIVSMSAGRLKIPRNSEKSKGGGLQIALFDDSLIFAAEFEGTPEICSRQRGYAPVFSKAMFYSEARSPNGEGDRFHVSIRSLLVHRPASAAGVGCEAKSPVGRRGPANRANRRGELDDEGVGRAPDDTDARDSGVFANGVTVKTSGCQGECIGELPANDGNGFKVEVVTSDLIEVGGEAGTDDEKTHPAGVGRGKMGGGKLDFDGLESLWIETQQVGCVESGPAVAQANSDETAIAQIFSPSGEAKSGVKIIQRTARVVVIQRLRCCHGDGEARTTKTKEGRIDEIYRGVASVGAGGFQARRGIARLSNSNVDDYQCGKQWD